MSSNIEPILVRDDKLMPKDVLPFAVYKSAQSIVVQPFVGASASPSSSTIQVYTPSVNTIISTEVLWQNTVRFKCTGTVRNKGDFLINIGSTDSLAPFPMHSLLTTATVTINSTTVSNNFVDTLPLMLQGMSKEELVHYASMTPTYLDNCQSYSSVYTPVFPVVAALPGTNAAADIQTASQTDMNGVAAQTLGFISALTTNNPLSSVRFADDENHAPRGAFAYESIEGNVAAPDNNTKMTVYITYRLVEPLLLSPFTTIRNALGMYGISNISAVFNFDSQAKRCWRRAYDPARFGTNAEGNDFICSIDSITQPTLIIESLTCPPDVILPQTNCHSYYDLPRYLTASVECKGGATFSNAVNAATGLTASSYKPNLNSASSQNIQLNQIPSKLFIAVKKQQSDLSYSDPDCFLPITKVSINWNNTSGLLSSADQRTLYRMSKEAGYAGSWNQWSGRANQAAYFNQNIARTADLNADATQSFFTAGAPLILDFGRHIALNEPALQAPGSIGQYNLQINVDYVNNTGADLTGQIIIMVMNSGLIAINNGSAQVYSGVLSKQMCLDASMQTPVSHGDLTRMIGKGSWWSSIKSNISSHLPLLKSLAEKALPEVRKALEGKEGVAGLASKGLKMAGYGASGGGMSGGRLAGRLM